MNDEKVILSERPEDLKKAVWYIQHCIAFEEEVHHDTV